MWVVLLVWQYGLKPQPWLLGQGHWQPLEHHLPTFLLLLLLLLLLVYMLSLLLLLLVLVALLVVYMLILLLQFVRCALLRCWQGSQEYMCLWVSSTAPTQQQPLSRLRHNHTH
jgi:hypothetical protein